MLYSIFLLAGQKAQLNISCDVYFRGTGQFFFVSLLFIALFCEGHLSSIINVEMDLCL